MDIIPKEVKDLIDYVAEYVSDETNEWFVVKPQLVNIFPPRLRSLFTRRHYSTKKHSVNDFEYLVMEYWKLKTGNRLLIDKTRLHDDNWKPRPKGWGLKKFNEDRRKQKKAEPNN